jgi:hypothetical protein
MDGEFSNLFRSVNSTCCAKWLGPKSPGWDGDTLNPFETSGTGASVTRSDASDSVRGGETLSRSLANMEDAHASRTSISTLL